MKNGLREKFKEVNKQISKIDMEKQTLKNIVIVNAFLTGFIIMAFEMLVSRFMYPHFGSGISTWAALISVAMMALMAGYSCGGKLADKKSSPSTLGNYLILAGIFIFFTPFFSDYLFNFCIRYIDSNELGSLFAAFVILFTPIRCYS
jgi:hypothetical protein